MSNHISASAFSNAVQSVLLDFVEDTKELMRQSVNAAGEEAVRRLQSSSPKKTGEYAKSWTLKRAAKTGSKITAVVYNKDHFQLTHLLEDGHARADGGRTDAHPHIAPAADAAAEYLEERILLEVGKNK